MNPRFAILLDGGFVTKALSVRYKAFPSVQQIEQECQRITALPHFHGFDLLRIYFYDGPPATGKLANPIDGAALDLAASPVFVRNSQLLEQIELLPNFALRKGETVVRGWKIGQRASQNMLRKPRLPTAGDLVPNVQQKGVDLRIGLDVARLALRDMVQVIVLVTGDSDMIPVFKFARREGVRMYLDHLGMPTRRDLKVHADIVL